KTHQGHGGQQGDPIVHGVSSLSGASRPQSTPVRCAMVAPQPPGWRDQVTAFTGRREFITLLGGAAAGWPLAAHAQASAVPVIGFLGANWRITRAPFIPALRQGGAEAGYSDAQTVRIEFRWAEGAYDRLPSLAADLVHWPVAVLVAGDGPSARASRAS